jgi:hypothetical protein
MDPPPDHRATLPSRASKPNPRIGRRCAKYRVFRASEEGGAGRLEESTRYRAEDRMDRVPQTPFMMVMRSAMRKLLRRVQRGSTTSGRGAISAAVLKTTQKLRAIGRVVAMSSHSIETEAQTEARVSL